jgi:hypothetical protein
LTGSAYKSSSSKTGDVAAVLSLPIVSSVPNEDASLLLAANRGGDKPWLGPIRVGVTIVVVFSLVPCGKSIRIGLTDGFVDR